MGKSICEGCIKSDVCDRKEIVRTVEIEIENTLEKGVIKDGNLTFDRMRMGPNYALKNMGVGAAVFCRSKYSLTEDN